MQQNGIIQTPPQRGTHNSPMMGYPQNNMPGFGFSQVSDNLKSLPTNKNKISDTDINLSNSLFGPHNRELKDTLVEESRDILVLGLLFIIFSLNQVDDIIKKFVPITSNSQYFLILGKAILVMILYWLIKHFYLSQK